MTETFPSLEEIVRRIDLLKTNAVDRLSAMLMVGLIFAGIGVVFLGLAYYSQQIADTNGRILVSPAEPSGRGPNAAGFAMELDPPGAEDVEEFSEPSLEQTLEAMIESLSALAGAIDSVDGALESSAGSGAGDQRQAGPIGEGENVVPRYERWELKFTARGVKQYAKMLDEFDIELAAAGLSPSVDYASNFSGTLSTRSLEDTSKEKRLYFIWREGQNSDLQEWSKELLSQAGVATDKRLILTFIDEDQENRLARLELEYAAAKKKREVSVEEITKTIFETKSTREGYQWEVVQQTYNSID